MGYTHYWTFRPIKGKAAAQETAYRKGILACQKLVAHYNKALKQIEDKHPDRLSGYTAHTKPGLYGGLKINGTEDLAHEDFCMPEHFKDSTGDFCKTNSKPYDRVVVACLIIMAHYLGDGIEVNSDGTAYDFQSGLELALLATKLKGLKIPPGVDRERARLRA